MVINFLCNPVFDGWEPTDTRLGGTEESIVEWSKELSKRGHDVTVYMNSRSGIPVYEGVLYMEREGFTPLTAKEADITINVKSSDIQPDGGKMLYLTNEFNASDLDLSAYKGVIWPSQWAVDNIPVNNKTFILAHGYDDTLTQTPFSKIKKQTLYASSPDRGLDVLLGAWPEVHALHPDATLIVTYGGELNLPGVTNLGEVDDEMMNELYRTSDIWAHPCTGGELYCMTGKKAQVTGCIPVIIPTMALAETVERGYKTDKEHYAQTLIEVLNLPMKFRDTIRQDVIKHANAVTWQESTDKLLAIIQNVLKS